MIQLQQINL